MVAFQDFHITYSLQLNVINVVLRCSAHVSAGPSCGNFTVVAALFDMMKPMKCQAKRHVGFRFTTSRRCIKASAHARAQGRSRSSTRARAAPAPGFVRHVFIHQEAGHEPHLPISSTRRHSAAPSTPAAHARQSKCDSRCCTLQRRHLHVSQTFQRQKQSHLLQPLPTRHARQHKNTTEGRDYLQRLPGAALQPRREERQHAAKVTVQLLRAEQRECTRCRVSFGFQQRLFPGGN